MHGSQHTAINLSVSGALCGLLAWGGQMDALPALGAGLLFGTLLVTPDLDLTLNDARRRWRPLRMIWGPYTALSTHRGRSHSSLFGPLSRLLYLTLFAAPLLWALRSVGAVWPRPSAGQAALFAAGYVLTQWAHLICGRHLARPAPEPYPRPGYARTL